MFYWSLVMAKTMMQSKSNAGGAGYTGYLYMTYFLFKRLTSCCTDTRPPPGLLSAGGRQVLDQVCG